MPRPLTERVKRHRGGLRPIQIWVPGTRREGFAAECRRQSLLLRDDPHEHETLDWLAATAEIEGWR
ncbi:MAG: antitoxin MazE family protein [Geminicoccaceae bacterium]